MNLTAFDTLIPAPKDGARGAVGPLPVPAGEYSSIKTYTATAFVAPYVLCEGRYYLLNKPGSFSGINPKTDYAAHGQNATWIYLENVQHVFTEILMAHLGLLGKAVFWDNYMFSQYGQRGGSTIETEGHYSAPTEAGGDFTPNILIDFLTGFFRCVNAEIRGTVNAEAGKIGGFEINENNLESEGDGIIYVDSQSDAGKNIFASIGVNVADVNTLGAGVFRNESTDGGADADVNRSLYLKAQGRKKNEAIRMDGGSVCGMAMRNTYVTASSHALNRFDFNVLALNTVACTVTLPQMMGHDDGHVIRIKRLGSGSLKVVAQKCYTYNGTTLRAASMPFMIEDRDSHIKGSEGIELQSACDGMELVWVRDISTVIDGTTYYGAWVQYKLPRDW